MVRYLQEIMIQIKQYDASQIFYLHLKYFYAYDTSIVTNDYLHKL